MPNLYAGVNLREEDVAAFTAACQSAGIDPASIPVLAILHDDTDASLAESYAAFANLTVAAWRCMSPNSQLPIRPAGSGGLPERSSIIGWNEADEPQDWWDAWWQQVRRQRPDLTIHYGAPNVDNEWPENAPLEAALDVVDRHIGSTFSPPPAEIAGKPVWVTEIDVDPGRFTVTGGPYPWGSVADMAAAYAELLGAMERCLQAGIPVFAWGIQSYAPDAAYAPAVLAAIAALNAKYAIGASSPVSPTDPQNEPTAPSTAVVQAQNGYDAQAEYKQAHATIALTQALHARGELDDATAEGIYNDFFDGASSVYGQLNAISPTAFPVPSHP